MEERTELNQLFNGPQVKNELEAYLLGFFYADGYITNYSYGKWRAFGIGLKAKDKNFLQWICDVLNKDLGTNYELKYQKETNSYRLLVCRVYFVEKLINLGIVPHKTYTNTNGIISNVPIELMNHFIRGFFDGDGSICIGKEGKARANFVGWNERWIHYLYCVLYSIIKRGQFKPEHPKDKEGSTYYRVVFSGNPSCVKLREFLYNNAHYYMKRKKDLFDSIKIYQKRNIYKGISRYRNKIKACIVFNNKKEYIGVYPSVKKAIDAYNKKAKQYNLPTQKYNGEKVYIDE